MVLVFCWLGIASLLLNLIPVVAISPILLYIGALIGAQAFQTTPKSHAPAICFALVPHLAAWAKVQIDGAVGAAGTSAAEVGTAAMANLGVLYEGMSILGNGAILSGLVIGAIVVFIIERQLLTAAAFAGAGAVLTFFGFMHGAEVGVAVEPMVAASYAIVAGFLFACAKYAAIEAAAPEADAEAVGAAAPAE
jgi:AGZA family xanthine/uracil permease-like MFS transporter